MMMEKNFTIFLDKTKVKITDKISNMGFKKEIALLLSLINGLVYFPWQVSTIVTIQQVSTHEV